MISRLELIRRLTTEERQEAMELASFENIVNWVVPRVAPEDLAALIDREMAVMNMYARYWDEVSATYPQHYFESKLLIVAGPMGWLYWQERD